MHEDAKYSKIKAGMIPCPCPAQRLQSCSPTQSAKTTFRLQSPRQKYLTFQGIPGEAQLAYDVSGNIGLDALADLGLTLCSLQTLVKLLGVKLLQPTNQMVMPAFRAL